MTISSPFSDTDTETETAFSTALAHAGRVEISGVREGQDAQILLHVARLAGGRGVLVILRDDARLAQVVDSLFFFDPAQPVLTLPAWDCLPYDRVSPDNEIVAQRIRSLARLAARKVDGPKAEGPRADTPVICVTTVNAVLQRVPQRVGFTDVALELEVGAQLEQTAFAAFLEHSGYGRAHTVREPGEFAIRGGIVDVFPTGSDEPRRLDFFGDELETIRAFDPMSQRSIGTRDRVSFLPVSEVLLDPPAIERFRAGYRARFGADTHNDPLYEAVRHGRRHAGIEHWLPLFHERLETLFDYLSEAVIVLDARADEVAKARFDQVGDAYAARRDLMTVGDRAAAYKPLPPELLHLDRTAFDEALATRTVATLSPFSAPADRLQRFDLGGRRGHEFTTERARPDANPYDAVRDHITELQDRGLRVLLAAAGKGSRERLISVLREHGLDTVHRVDSLAELEALTDKRQVGAALWALEQGFVAGRLAVVTEQDILGDRLIRARRRRAPKRKADAFLTDIASLNAGDFVVHVEHGIGQYSGLEALVVGEGPKQVPHDCLCLVYAGGDKLFVPVENLEVLTRYGAEESGAQLDKLGGAAWQARKARVKKRLKDMADGLIRIAADRTVRAGATHEPASGSFDEFCTRFPFAETDDQLKAIDEVLGDLRSGRPMDRLVCGDVGFGKTEVALRAAFAVAMDGYQVAIVVPTTLLARQHFRTFSERFRGFGVEIGQISRLVTGRDATRVKKAIAVGDIHIAVGTHALLGKTIRFADLGLVIIDEEQHFGVAQKERLKQLRARVHVLTLTATPIPRTLQMSLSGVKDMSIIATPPVDRLAVRTFVLPFDGLVIREAILREHYRGGQTFYVCPRIEDMPRLEERLRKLVPEVRLATAHGQLPGSELEEVMGAFVDGHFDILLSTNIVESGLDIPRANTLVVHRADRFGLAQLYQLRGRVGRSKTRAYAYLTLHETKALTATARRRLDVMQTLDHLGAGFTLASHDLDIRGAGNLLGEEQSGHVREVGIELYQHMLEEAVAEARAGGADGDDDDDGKGADATENWSPQITLGTPVLIPESYVPDLSVRLSLYRRIAHLEAAEDIDGFAGELIDRFGSLPPEVDNLFKVIAVKQLCRRAGIEKMEAGPKGAVIRFRNDSFANPAGLVQFIQRQGGMCKLRADHKLVYRRNWYLEKERVAGVQHLLKAIVKLL